MQAFESIIPLTWWQQAIFICVCVWIVAAAHPEVGLAIYLSIASWTRGFLIASVAQFWILLVVMGLATLRLILFAQVKPFVLPPHKRGVLAWLIIWWAWMIILCFFFLPYFDQAQWTDLYKNTILYTLIPMPLILFLPKEINRVVYFAGAYILTSVVGGMFAVMMLNIPFSYLLADPTSITRRAFALGISNYHWFAYQFAISLIFIFALFVYIKNILVRVGLIVPALLCVYFLILSSSRQSILGFAIALLFCFIWEEFSGKGTHRFWVVALVTIVIFSAYWLVIQVPNVLRIGLSSSGSLPDIALLQDIIQKRSAVSWQQGLNLLPESPVWGLGFSQYSVSHNLFLGTIVDQGIIGLVFLLGFLIFWFGEARLAWKTTEQPDLRIWKLAMVAIMVFVLVQSQFSGNPLSEWAMWWSTMFLWCLNGLDVHAEKQKQVEPVRERYTRLVRYR
jgi:O-Antigen ligase